jgi:hypothetical protein
VKKHSIINKQVLFEVWDAPVVHAPYLDLETIFQTRSDIYFFFHARNKKKLSTFFYLKVDRLTPFKMTEECIAYGNIWKYVREKKSKLKEKRHYIRTYQLWNTPYVKELDANFVLSGYAKKRDKNISQYMIRTDDETIELVARKFEWVSYEGFNTQDIIEKLIKDLNFTV